MKKTRVFLLIFSLFSVSEITLGQHTAAHFPDKPATQGMMIFATEKCRHIYASHLPMFHTPHDYQLIVELSFDKKDSAAFVLMRQQFPNETVFTLEPEKFVLPAMVAKPTSFVATLYKGHFERGGKPFLTNITVSVKEILYFKKLEATLLRQPQLRYLLFGDLSDMFLVHLIDARPNFDQIIRIEANHREINNIVHKERCVTVSSPLVAGSYAPGLGVLRSITLAEDKVFQIKNARILYEEHQDLE